MLSRRSFLAVGGGALGGAMVGALLPRTASAAAGDFGSFTVGIQSYTFRKFNLEQALKRTQEAGLKFAEFYRGHVPTDSSPEKLAAIKKLCAEYDVTPIAFGVERFTKDHDANRKLFDFGTALGIKHFSADPDPDSFDSLDKLCAEYKISIAIHPHGPSGKGLHRWAEPKKIFDAVKNHHELIGTCLDTGHLIRSSQLGLTLDPAESVKVMGARNLGLHLKDHDNKKKTDVVYGDPAGVLDVRGVLKTLQSVKFSGYISIEYEANPDDPSPDVKKCVQYLKTAIAKL
jgi:inosose dehydratase